MFEKKDYSKFTLEELRIEETKAKKTQKNISIIASIAVGVTLYALFKKSVGFIHCALPLGCGMYLGTNAENIKAIQKEMNNRKLE